MYQLDLGMYRGQNRPSSVWWEKGSSTIYALTHLLHEWFIDTDALKPVIDIVLIDSAKAYDHFNHNIIVTKLIDMDVPPILTNGYQLSYTTDNNMLKLDPQHHHGFI